METESLHETTVSVVVGDPSGTTEVPSNDKVRLSDKQVMREIGNDVLRLGLDLACCSEKLVNMNLLMMHVSAKECDFEGFTVEQDDSTANSSAAALEFDVLSGYFDLEVKEMDNFIGRLQSKFQNASDAISAHKHLGMGFLKLEEQLHDTEKSLKQSQEQVSELMMQSVKFQRILLSSKRRETSNEDKEVAIGENGEYFNASPELQMQTSEQQRHILEMLEKSLARELDLENQLAECVQTLDKMKRKLHYSRQEVLSAEEETAAVYARFLEADNSSAVLMGISKELMGQLQSCQLNMNSSLIRESELSNKLQNCMQAIQKLEKREAISEQKSLDALVLKEKTNALEEQLQQAMVSVEASEEKQSMFCSSIEDMELVIEKLKKNVSSAESRAVAAESECILLTEANTELNKELDLVKVNSIFSEKVALLEKQLQETVIQLEQATASVEASQEKQTTLYSSISKMEKLIEKLKSNILEADTRADSAEDKCIILSESHAELNEELNYLRSKVGRLEASLQQIEEAKLASANDINIRTKVITDLVVQLALERERLHKQISWLMEVRPAHEDTSQMANKPSYNPMNREIGESDNSGLSSEYHVRSSVTRGGDNNICGITEVHKSAESISNGESNTKSEELKYKLETVRTIDAGRLNFRHVLSASFVVLVAVVATCFLSPENCPF